MNGASDRSIIFGTASRWPLASNTSMRGRSGWLRFTAITRPTSPVFKRTTVPGGKTEISVFPPGTVVRLNTGEVGRVIAVNRNHPLRPRIEVFDAKGQRLAVPKMIDLSEAPFIYITGPVSESAR